MSAYKKEFRKKRVSYLFGCFVGLNLTLKLFCYMSKFKRAPKVLKSAFTSQNYKAYGTI